MANGAGKAVQMPAVPREGIFHQVAGTVFLVVNWRERRRRTQPARLLRLSPRHERLFHASISAGHRHQRIYALMVGGIGQRRGRASADDGHGDLPGGPRRAQPGVPARGMGWAISAVVHAMLLLALCSVCWVMQQPAAPVPNVSSARLDLASPSRSAVPGQALSRDLADPQVLFSDADPQPSLPAMVELTPDAVAESPTDEVAALPPVPPGSEAATLPIAKLMIGAVGAGGAFASRGAARRHHAVGVYGGSVGSEAAVDAALRWFKRHQSLNGRWEVSGYQDRCQETPRCEPDGLRSGSIANDLDTDCAVGGLALLCYLGAGYDQDSPSRYRAVVERGLAWLTSTQPADGFFGKTNYGNAIATMAVCEAFALSHDPSLRRSAQRGVDAILRRQNRAYAASGALDTGDRLGWDYLGPDERDDTSVTGWNVMALKSARLAGLDVGAGLDGAERWLDSTWRAANPQWRELDGDQLATSRFPYDFQRHSGAFTLSDTASCMHDLASVAAVCAAFMPHPGSRVELTSLARYLVQNQMVGPAAKAYYRYYATLALFQLGGPLWQTWNDSVRGQLVSSQRAQAGCLDGSWDAGSGDYGRLVTTALNCLSLEVYYRYQRIVRPPGVRYPDGVRREP